MSFTEKLQSVFVIVAILIGLILGQIKWVEENAVFLIVPSLMVMLYGVFLNVPLNRLGQAFQIARNSPLALAIATSVFPDRPLIILVLAIEPLIELPVMVLVSQLLLFLRRKGQYS